MPLICHRFVTAGGEEMTKQSLVLLQNEWLLRRWHVRHSRCLDGALLQTVNTLIVQRVKLQQTDQFTFYMQTLNKKA